MKKILKALLILIGFLPMICNAQSEEVKWKWYKEVESEVHYEKDAKNICEYFDENNYILGDYQYSLNEPEKIEGREIIKEDTIIPFDTRITNRLFINNFHIQNSNIKIYEIEIFDINNKKLNYNIEINNLVSGEANNINDGSYETFIEVELNSYIELVFKESAILKGIKIVVTFEKNENDFEGITFSNYLNEILPTKSFQPYQTTNTINCEENICKLITITPSDDNYYEKINIKTPIYKYKDKYYKCFTNKKIYVPGYYKELIGFTKDENDFIKAEKESIDKEENQNDKIVSMINKFTEKNEDTLVESEELINLLNDIRENIKGDENTSKTENENKQVSYNDKVGSNIVKTDEKKESNYSYLYLLSLIIITILVTITYFVKKSRAK